jgi:hypothetical protein
MACVSTSIARAAADGVDVDAVEEARDKDDPKSELIGLIVEVAESQAVAAHSKALRAKAQFDSRKANLAILSVKELRGTLSRRLEKYTMTAACD